MLVDWFTVAAQLINFAVLVWLLKRLLYKRILKAMDERQEALSKEASEAEHQRERARREAAAYTEKLAKFEADYAASMKKAEDEIRSFRSQKLSEVRTEMQEQRNNWNRSLEKQRYDFVRKLRKLIGSQVCETARKLIIDISDAPLEQQVLRHFAASLASDDSYNQALMAALSDGAAGLSITTTFPVETETKSCIENTLSKILPPNTSIEYEHDFNEGGLGIVLRAGNHRLEWNADSYADQLTLNVETALFGESIAQAGKPTLASA